MVDYSFIEYSFNPETTDKEYVYSNLNRLGFIHRTQHKNKDVGFWVQNNCIILLRESNKIAYPGISGLGFIAEGSDFVPGIAVDPDSDMLCAIAPDGTRFLFVHSDQMISMLTNNFETVDIKEYSNPGLKYISGINLNLDTATEEFYKSMGFVNSKSAGNFRTLVSDNKRFNLLLHENFKPGIPSLYIDTDDMFHTVACFTITGIESPSYEHDIPSGFGNMTYKIAGYKCLAAGNSQSFSIEKFLPGVLPGLDIIVRMRKQYINISEKLLSIYYGT